MIAPVDRSNWNRGTAANAVTIPRMKLNAMLIVVANFPANCSYAGFAKFTMEVITVAQAIAVIISVDICIIDRM